MDNSVSRIIKVMRNQGSAYNAPSIILANVVSAQPNFMIKVGNIQVDKDNLLIADHLLKDYSRAILSDSLLEFTQFNAGMTESETIGSYGSHSHAEHISVAAQSVATGTIKFTDSLKVGDRLAVMPTSDGQTFIILAKVVKL